MKIDTIACRVSSMASSALKTNCANLATAPMAFAAPGGKNAAKSIVTAAVKNIVMIVLIIVNTALL
jgi:hypothetical protein